MLTITGEGTIWQRYRIEGYSDGSPISPGRTPLIIFWKLAAVAAYSPKFSLNLGFLTAGLTSTRSPLNKHENGMVQTNTTSRTQRIQPHIQTITTGSCV